MRYYVFISICWICLPVAAFAQQDRPDSSHTEITEPDISEHDKIIKKLQQLKISGYLQTQYQWGQENASLKVGDKNKNPEQSFDRFGIKRGRLKFTYEENIASGVFQLDLTDKGIAVKDAYLNIKDPWIRMNSLCAGIFNRPFGFEINYSSSQRESPERSTVFQTLFPEERDLGVMLQIQADKNSPWNFVKLNAGLFAGNGIKQETDSRKDFIGQLIVNKNLGKNIHISGGFSYYYGSVYQGTENVYKMEGKSFLQDSNPANKSKFAKREYFGFDLQLSLNNPFGPAQLRGEYLFGQQPGKETGSISPNSSELPSTDTYIRNFSGGYIVFIQDLGITPLSAVFKYDWYDPNTKIKEEDIGLNNTGTADVARQTYGIGIIWKINTNLRLQTFYEFNNNEKTKHLSAYFVNIKDDVFTLRLQYKF
jgi:phosphate-selective porin